jgi:hypothetical protein
VGRLLAYFYMQNGGAMTYGGSDTIYAFRGGGISTTFSKYSISTDTWTSLTSPPVPPGAGADLLYDSETNRVYAFFGYDNPGNYNGYYFYYYDVATDTWTKLNNTPQRQNYGSNLVSDANGNIYAVFGSSYYFYRYDKANDSWTQMANIYGNWYPQAGAEMVRAGNYFYLMLGDYNGGTQDRDFVRYDISNNSWSRLTDTPDTVRWDNSAMAWNGGDSIYVIRTGSTFWKYKISEDTWETITGPSPYGLGGGGDMVYVDGIIYANPGTTYNLGMYRYVTQTDTTSFVSSGTYESPVFDLGGIVAYASISVEYTTPSNTSVTVETKSSSDNSSWSDWTTVADEKVNGNVHTFQIASTAYRYLKIRLTLRSSDNIYSPTVSSYTITYFADNDPPTIPSSLDSYKTATKSATIEGNTWYNLTAPYFEWSGASDATGSGVAGYYVYFGPDADADASSSGAFRSSTNYTASLSEDGEYYLRIQAKDNAGNVSANWTAFHYRYDGTSPEAPSSVAADPRNYTAVNSFTMFWTQSSDVTSNATSSGLLGYYYKTGTSSGQLASDQFTTASQVTGITAYQDGTNTFYVRSVDNAGNISSYTTTSYYYNGTAPSAPTNLTVTPSSSTTNSFSFDWDEPLSYQGSISEYRYSVNSLPSANNYTTVSTSGLSAGPYATIKGTNVFYVVAVDEAGNVNYDAYASIEFTANTAAPGIPQNLEAFDNSIRATKQYKVGLTWDPPSDLGTGFAGYAIYASDTETSCDSTASNFTLVGTTGGTTYVVADIDGEALESKTYYFCIRAYDSTNQYSAASSTVSLLPTGRWLVPPDLTSGPTPRLKPNQLLLPGQLPGGVIPLFNMVLPLVIMVMKSALPIR